MKWSDEGAWIVKRRIVFLDTISTRSTTPGRFGFPGFDVSRWFAEDGWVEGRDLTLDYLDIDTVIDKRGFDGLQWALREAVASRPDAILVVGAGGTFARQLRQMTDEVPIVFYALSVDPVRMKLVKSLRQPGGMVTGTAWPPAEVTTTQNWELLVALRPEARRIGVILHADFPRWDWAAEVSAAHAAVGARLKLEVVPIMLPGSVGFDIVERRIRAARVDLLEPETGWTDMPWRQELIRFAQREKIAASWDEGFVRDGGLCCVTPSLEEASREAVKMVAAVLRGRSPATMPVYQSTRFTTWLNLRTARAMGLAIPPAVRLRVDRFIE